jgi:membrane-bound serine protease (ClpP class)
MVKIVATVLSLLATVLLAASLRAQTTQPSAMPTTSTPAAVVVLKGSIDDWRRDELFRRFDEARREGAKTIILRIDTPGGLVTAGLDISRFLKAQSDLHVIAFVHNQAISAGAMIAMACDEIVMEPGSEMGDCAPIVFRIDGTLENLPAAERAKAESPIIADFEDSARRNGYDVLLAQAMVAVGKVVHYVTNDSGEKRFVNEATYQKLLADGWKPVPDVPDPVDSADRLLTVHSTLASKLGLSKGEFSSPEELGAARNLNIIATLAPGAGDAFVEILASPITRLLLIIVFVGSLKLALSTPGHGAPEAVALISLGLLVGIPLLTGYAQWWEIAIIFLGLALVAFEVFVFPGHFVSAVVGVLMIIVGLVFTFVGKEPTGPGFIPHMPMTWAAIQRGLLVVTAGLACSMALWIWLNRYLPKIPYFNRIVLQPAGGDPTLMGALGADVVWPLVGSIGKAVSELKPGGSAEFLDETINDTRVISVVSDSGFLPPGSDVVVTESRGSFIVVRKARSA